jgi:glutamate synthase (NADPH/NADH) small chain
MFRTSSAHEEGGERVFAVNTSYFADDGNGHVAALHLHEVEMQVVEGRPNFVKIEETDYDLPADLVLLALGFAGPSPSPLFDQLGVSLTPRGIVGRDATWKTNVDGVYVCGDMGRGQSLIVWAIAEGRSCAAAVDAWLMGSTLLPAPLSP